MTKKTSNMLNFNIKLTLGKFKSKVYFTLPDGFKLKSKIFQCGLAPLF